MRPMRSRSIICVWPTMTCCACWKRASTKADSSWMRSLSRRMSLAGCADTVRGSSGRGGGGYHNENSEEVGTFPDVPRPPAKKKIFFSGRGSERQNLITRKAAEKPARTDPPTSMAVEAVLQGPDPGSPPFTPVECRWAAIDPPIKTSDVAPEAMVQAVGDLQYDGSSVTALVGTADEGVGVQGQTIVPGKTSSTCMVVVDEARRTRAASAGMCTSARQAIVGPTRPPSKIRVQLCFTGLNISSVTGFLQQSLALFLVGAALDEDGGLSVAPRARAAVAAAREGDAGGERLARLHVDVAEDDAALRIAAVTAALRRLGGVGGVVLLHQLAGQRPAGGESILVTGACEQGVGALRVVLLAEALRERRAQVPASQLPALLA